uniref:CCHC-type domain-containing protein n=1 Tax=Setaria italica TaxID=4555 RepID=K3Z0T3_SETIT
GIPPTEPPPKVDTGDARDATQEDQEGKNKPYCYRCLTKGHINTECSTQISCDLCDTHVTKACPQAKAAKQTAMLCGYAVDCLGFYYSPFNGKLKVQSESKAAVVKVIEEEKGNNTFTTTFPSRSELTLMVLWGSVETKIVKAKMEVHENKETDVYKYEIPKCWVQFRGLPQKLREEVPIIWAVRSILGVTKMVDMRFTKQYDVARLRVAVLKPDLIPDFVEVVIGEYVYELQFRVEKDCTANNPVPINMETDPENEGNSDGETDKDKLNEENNKDEKGGMEALGSGKGTNGEILTPSANNSDQNKGKQKPVVVLSPSTDGSNTWTATPMQTLVEKEATNAAEPLHVNANVKITPTRTSKKNATANDQDSVERAAKLNARKI